MISNDSLSLSKFLRPKINFLECKMFVDFQDVEVLIKINDIIFLFFRVMTLRLLGCFSGVRFDDVS